MRRDFFPRRPRVAVSNAACFAAVLCGLSFLAGCDAPRPAPAADDSWLDGWKNDSPAPAAAAAAASPMLDNRQTVSADETHDDVPPHWTGAIVYSLPGCRACERLIAGLRSRSAAGWKTGIGPKNHFVLVKLQTEAEFQARGLTLAPSVVYVVDGREVARVVGFGGTTAQLDAILEKHPSAKRRGDAPVRSSLLEFETPLWYEAPPVLVSSPPIVVASPPRSVAVGTSCSVLGVPLFGTFHQHTCAP